MGWNVPPSPEGTPHGYQMIATGAGHVGGLLRLSYEMRKNGAKPTWLFYISVDDVDATAQKVEAAGGTLLMKPFDIPNAGRAAMIADPQGIPFYVMHEPGPARGRAGGRDGLRRAEHREAASRVPGVAPRGSRGRWPSLGDGERPRARAH